jgi:RHS repeat-associated protein
VQYGYDAVGNRTSLTNARGQATTFTYDNLNRLTGINYPDGSTVAYTYDAVGNRTQMVDSTGTTTYAYDALNRVTSITNPGSRVVGYGYDAAGNRTGVTYPDGKTVTYNYDDANRLIRVADWASRQTTYAYDNVGNLTGQTNPNNTTVSLTYDAANRLTGLIHTSTVSGTIASFSYTMDRVGNRIRVVDTEGTTTYEYDKLYRLTSVTYPDATFAAYQYDPMGNRTVMTTTLGVTTYTYDGADRLLSAGATTFTWDADGNMLSKGSMTFTYDAANRLTQAISGTTTVDFVYDGDGRRASKTVNGTATTYTYDTIAGLAYVLAEQTAGNITLYTYGTDLIAQTAPDGTQSHYHPDGLGSTRALSGGSGQITARYNYDAFGALRSPSGASSIAFKFAGEQTDDEIGLIYLRARYYDPSLGRFISRDPWPALADATPGLNRYVYAANNPVNVVDPSGAFNLKQIGQGAWDFLGGVGTVGKSLALGGIASGLCATGLGCVIGAPIGVYAANESFVGGQKIGAGLYEIGEGVVKSGEAPVEHYEAIDPLAYGLEEVGARAAPRLGYQPDEGRLAGRVLKLVIDVGTTLALHANPTVVRDTRAYYLWRGGVIPDLSWSRTIGDIMSNPLTQVAGSLSHISRARELRQAAQGPGYIGQAEITNNYMLISRTLKQSGFNPASPQPPPSGSK